MTIKRMKSEDVAALRTRLKMTQREFWKRVGMTQSAGCRYERGGRAIPNTMQMLITLAYSRNPMPFLKQLRNRPDKSGSPKKPS
jgi:transcriptional regulator with XRE-family HTH domain